MEDESPTHGNFSPQALNGATARLLLVVDDPAAAVERALAAGAREVQTVAELYGWLLGRGGPLRPPLGDRTADRAVAPDR